MGVSDKLGDRMKAYETQETQLGFLPLVPVYARLDGRTFSKFTKGLARPFDERLSNAMQKTTIQLVQEYNALVGFTQSDEISLCWLWPTYNDMPFGGTKQKLVSSLAAHCTAFFIQAYLQEFGIQINELKKLPTFDCRIFHVPTKAECVNQFRWRQRDAIKNAVSMAAYSYFPHKEMDKVTTTEKKAKLIEVGIDFEAYPNFFKHGVFITRQLTNKIGVNKLTGEEVMVHRRVVTIQDWLIDEMDKPVEMFFGDQ